MSWVHALHVFGAAAIAAFGWGVCRAVEWDASRWMPLWFCGALLAYNLDRLKEDAADAVNVPERRAASRVWRGWSRAVIVGAAAVLWGVPWWRRDWVTLALAVAGSAVCLAYSLPPRGWRLKDLPVVKTLIPPTVVAATIFTLPWLAGARAAPAALLAAIGWAWTYLLANMIFCDLRDLAGDRRMGVRSLPALLGERRSRGFVALLAVMNAGCGIAAWSAGIHAGAWLALAWLGPACILALLRAVRVRRTERFYEWWVEGMLFLPAVVIAGEALVAWIC